MRQLQRCVKRLCVYFTVRSTVIVFVLLTFSFFFSQNHTGYVEKYVASVNQTELACRFTRCWDGVGTFSLRIYIRLIFFYCVKAIFQKGILFLKKIKMRILKDAEHW